LKQRDDRKASVLAPQGAQSGAGAEPQEQPATTASGDNAAPRGASEARQKGCQDRPGNSPDTTGAQSAPEAAGRGAGEASSHQTGAPATDQRFFSGTEAEPGPPAAASSLGNRLRVVPSTSEVPAPQGVPGGVARERWEQLSVLQRVDRLAAGEVVRCWVCGLEASALFCRACARWLRGAEGYALGRSEGRLRCQAIGEPESLAEELAEAAEGRGWLFELVAVVRYCAAAIHERSAGRPRKKGPPADCCPVCGGQKRPGDLLCGVDWRRVSRRTQETVVRTWRACRDGGGAGERRLYEAALRAAVQEAAQEREGRR